MGIHRTGNGGNWPPEGGSPDDQPDLPELPAEWGPVVVPDDPAELAAEAEQVRRELAGESEPIWRPPSDGGTRDAQRAVGLPLLIMAVAVLITMVSLFAMAWSGVATPRPSGSGPRPAPNLTLTDPDGQPVALRTLAPSVIILSESCDCAELVAETAAQAPPGVIVVAVAATTPSAAPTTDGAAEVVRLADPGGTLRAALGLSPPTGAGATVALVDRDHQLADTVRGVVSVRQFQIAMSSLATE